MFNYKGYTIWFNSCRGEKPWLVQSGYQIMGEYRTKKGAKSAITQWENRATAYLYWFMETSNDSQTGASER